MAVLLPWLAAADSRNGQGGSVTVPIGIAEDDLSEARQSS
jgi:hypothetical protein